MCAWAYGTIYGWQLEMDLYLALLPRVIAVIPVLYTVSLSVLESPLALESLLESLLGSLLDSLLDSLLEVPHLRAALERAALQEE
jgi:hypothetical protein